MHRLLESSVLVGVALTSLPLLLGAAVRGVALLAAAILVAMLLRKVSAAARHFVWVTALTGLLALPGLSLILPEWPVVPTWLDPSTLWRAEPGPVAGGMDNDDRFVAMAAARLRRRPAGESPHSGAESDRSSPDARTADPATGGAWGQAFSRLDRSAVSLVFLIWAAGTAMLCLRLAASQIGLWTLVRRSERVPSGRIYALLDELRQQAGVKRPVRLLRSECRTMPMTWGLLRSYSLLPSEAEHWDEGRLRAVLLHELGHIKRWDSVTQLVVQIACALYWFHPLVWLAAWRVEVEQERACDDFVLNRGSKASEYAGHLLGIVTGYDLPGLSGRAAMAMARKKKARLERRLARVLDGHVNRRGPSSAFLAGAFLAAVGFVAGLGMMRAEETGSPAPREGKTEAERAKPLATTPGAPVGEDSRTQPGEEPPTITKNDMTRRDFGKDCLRSGCHASLGKASFLHGPVAVGACDDCHEFTGKETEHGYRLSASGNKLCVSCHVFTPADTTVHGGAAKGSCLDCHDPHGGRSQALLRYMRVLYLEGKPRWEYRFLSNALLRDQHIGVQCYLTSADPGFPQPSSEGLPPLREVPADREALFEFDAIVVGDLPQDWVEKNPKLPSLLEQFLREKGGGLVVVAGRGFDPSAEFADLLPARLEAEDPSPSVRGAQFSPRLTPEGRQHEILRLVDDPEENQRLWEEELPSLQSYRRIAGVKPGSDVLCVHPEGGGKHGGSPLMVLGRLGRGRLLLVATDSLWRWRQAGAGYHGRFWKRALIYVAYGTQRAPR